MYVTFLFYIDNIIRQFLFLKDPFSNTAPTLPLETQHTSLRRRKDQHVQPPAALYSPIMERNEVH